MFLLLSFLTPDHAFADLLPRIREKKSCGLFSLPQAFFGVFLFQKVDTKEGITAVHSFTADNAFLQDLVGQNADVNSFLAMMRKTWDGSKTIAILFPWENSNFSLTVSDHKLSLIRSLSRNETPAKYFP